VIQCSTPFGIKDQLRGGSLAEVGKHQLVLNAFRHQRSTQRRRVSLAGIQRSAQRLSASKINSGPGARNRQPDIAVLNAFRHQRSTQFQLVSDVADHLLCSTPFGIKDQLSRIRSHDSLSRFCAQRLSASKINSGLTLISILAKRKCSTPFGIKDQLSYDRNNYLPGVHVLNAFRHQRSTQRPSGSCFSSSCSAQRLSASKINSGKQELRVFRIDHVLNAFRHQRSTQRYKTASAMPSSSAQRLSASKINSAHPRVIPPISASVLNAFRHQRSTQGQAGRQYYGVSCAQRLSASKINSVIPAKR